MKQFRRAVSSISAMLLAMIVFVAIGEAHDLFLRPRDFVASPGATVDVRVLNGTFGKSEGAVTRNRLRDLSVVGPAGVSHPSDSTWSTAGNESRWRVHVGDRGTYVLAASLAPSTIRLTGEQFDAYLREEGLGRVAEARKQQGIAAKPARERYAKHVKALVRVIDRANRGRQPDDTAYRYVLGYPAELVPLEDPYRAPSGAVLRVRALVDGQPLAGHTLLAGGRTTTGGVIAERAVNTDSDGVARVRLSARGTWYVKFIHMRAVPATAGDSVDYESKWATLTFARP